MKLPKRNGTKECSNEKIVTINSSNLRHIDGSELSDEDQKKVSDFIRNKMLENLKKKGRA
jgi:hypothetical protein